MRPILCVVASFVAAFLTTPSWAQTWDNGGSGNNWTTANNWNPNAAPVNNGTANLYFNGSLFSATNSNVNVAYDIWSIDFSGGFLATHTLTGQTLTIRSGISASGLIVGTQINNNIVTPNTLSLASGSLAGLTLNGNLSGNGGINVTQGGITLNGTNSTYTGVTTVSSGTLELNGSLSNTSNVVLSGGSLTLGANERINNNATLTLSGGTLNVNNHSETLGNLTLTANSTIDFGGSQGQLTFSNGTYTGGLLTLTNFDRDTNAIFFASKPSQTFLDNVYWSDLGIMGSHYVNGEIVPVPEPTAFAAVGLLSLFGLWHYRRQKH